MVIEFISSIHSSRFPSIKKKSPTLGSAHHSRRRALQSDNSTVASSCANEITPSCLQSLYGIPTTPATQSSNQIGVAGFGEQYADNQDLKVGPRVSGNCATRR